MRHSLLLITALTMPAHAELHEQGVKTGNTLATSSLSYDVASSSDLLAKSLCWLPTSLADNGQENCLVKAIQNSAASIGNLGDMFNIASTNLPKLHIPHVDSGTWSFVADIGYQFLLKPNSGEQLGKHLEASTNAAPLASMPLATVTWFVLGGMLGSLALTRRRLTKLAMANS